MQFVNIHDAKTNLSKYLEILQTTHEGIVICKNGKPIGQLTEYKPQSKRVLGLLKGKISVSKDFDKLPSELEEFFK